MGYKYLTLEDFKTRFYQKYPESTLVFLELLNSKKVKVKTKFGICVSETCNLYSGKIPTINSSVNKTEYFINQAIEIHGDKYDYSLVEYKSSHAKIKIICKVHGVFEQSASGHLVGRGCRICGGWVKSNTEEFILKANKKHKSNFDYSLVNYVNAKTNVKIVCRIHGCFEQTPNNHLNSKICCPLCENQQIKERLLKNPVGWNYNLWEEAGNKSKNFDSFKVYIIKCWNNTEEFYKIGKTYRKVKERFHNEIEMPYNFMVVKEITGQALEISKLENYLKNKNKNHKYMPKIIFEGKHECYLQLEDYENIFK